MKVIINTNLLKQYIDDYDIKAVIFDKKNLKNLIVDEGQLWFPCYKGHKLGEWIEDTKPTTVSEGSEHRECSQCEYIETRSKDKLPPLTYVLSKDESYYIVVGTDAFVSGEITIPREYEGKPVISIGQYAFHDCDDLTGVVIPDSVDTIDEWAFRGCSSITRITIPDSVVYIGPDAFLDCPIEEATIPAIAIPYIKNSNLKTVVITSGTDIENESFAGFKTLTSVVIGDSVITIGDYAFNNCTNLADIVIGNGVETIGRMAFSSTIITNLLIPDSVKTIGVAAFYDCSNLADVIIGNGVETIGNNAFSSCDNLKDVYYNGTEEEWNRISIGSGNEDLTNATRYYYSEVNPHREGNYWYRDENGEIATWPPHVHTEEIIPAVPATCTTTGWTEGKKCSVCGDIYVEQEIVPALGHTYGDWIIDIPPTCTVNGSKHKKCTVCDHIMRGEIPATGHSYTSVFTPPTCTEKGYTTYTCSTCGDIYVGNEVAALGHTIGPVVVENEKAATCTKAGSHDNVIYCTVCGEELFRATIVDNATGHTESDWIIDEEATCTKVGKKHTECTVCGETIKEETIPDDGHIYVGDNCTVCGTTSLDYFEFTGYSTIEWRIKAKDINNMPSNVVIPDSYDGNPVTEIDYHAFENCTNLTSVVIPDSVTRIDGWAFAGCSNLTSITIPDSVTSIGFHAFDGCTSLTSVTIGNSVTSIGEEAFRGCKGLTNITIPDSVTEIGGWAFGGCSSLTSVTIPDSVTSIGDRAFSGCSSLTSITIPDSVTYIGSWAFSHSDGLASVVIGDSVTAIGSYAFYECSSLKSVVIGDSVTSIGMQAFYNCTSLTSVTIPESVTSIGDGVSFNCINLTSVYYGGSEEKWNSIVIDSGNILVNNNRLINATRYYYSETHPTTSGNWHWVNGEPTVWCCNIQTLEASAPTCTKPGLSEGKFCATCGETVVPPQETSPALGHQEIYVIDKPATCIEFGNWHTECAICGETLGFGFIDPKGHDEIHHDAKAATCEEAGWDAYVTCSRCDYTTYKEIPALGHNYVDGVCTNCGDLYFFDFTLLTDGTYSISAKNVANMPSEVIIPKTHNGKLVTSIGSWAFYGCSSLTSITIPDSVTTISERAFENCSSLTSITIPDSVTTIEDYVFTGCSKLNSVVIPDGITYIGWCLFDGCSSLTSVNIPNNVTIINKFAFRGCSSLTSIIVPDKVTLIEEGAFNGCTNLSSLVIGKGVANIGGNTHWAYKPVFEGCYNLNIQLDEDNAHHKIEGGCLIEIQTGWIKHANKGNISISSTVTGIGAGAFSGAYAAPIKIPLSVTDIQPLAFKECQGLTVYVEADTKPDGWADDWHDGSVTVVWGYVEEDTNIYLVTEDGYYLTDEQGNLLII